ncbi:unnamed protein product, partial [Pocillopora meandrina]
RILRTPVNYLLMNLAISDLMIVISFTPRHILEGLYHYPRGLQGTLLCKTVTSDTFTWVGAVSSATTLVVLAYERYAAITFPLGTRSKLSCRKLKILVGLGWFFSVIFNIPLFDWNNTVLLYGNFLREGYTAFKTRNITEATWIISHNEIETESHQNAFDNKNNLRLSLYPNLILYVVWYYALEAEIMYTI